MPTELFFAEDAFAVGDVEDGQVKARARCAFLRDGIEPDELWFILGWCLTPLCTRILKEVLNHTRNIQSKDFERLPYPFWVGPERKSLAIHRCRQLVETAMRSANKVRRTDREVMSLVECYDRSDS